MNKSPAMRATRGAVSVIALLLLGLIGFITWAALFEIEQTVRAQGQIIPLARTQIVQAADGGVLSKILVQEGETVKAGQTLAILERDRPNAAYQESRAKQAALAAAIERVRAESKGRAPRFAAGDSPFEAAQAALYTQRKRALEEELATLTQALGLAHEELRINESLLKTGDVSRIEVMRSRRQVSELEGKISGARNKYLQEAHQESAKLTEELSSTRYKVDERQNVLGHTVLSAPVAGIVKYLKVTTIGGVLRGGDELMQISPTGGGVILEVKINPADIGQLRLGLPASVRLDAFDYAIYGTLDGTLTYTSSDTLTEQSGNGQSITYYRAQVRLDTGKPNPKLAVSSLRPGMTATVDIRTNTRTVLQYLTKPVFKAFSGALKER